MISRSVAIALATHLFISTAAALPARPPSYDWLKGRKAEDDLARRFAPPPGAERVKTSGFGEWLRHLPLLPPDTQVQLFDGTLKARQEVHAAVVDLDVGTRDLQQCADAVMRLRAEYLYAGGRPVEFHPDPGKKTALRFEGHERARFQKYLIRLFADAGSASLQAELRPISSHRIQPGDVLIQGGYPGHAVLVLDVAEGAGGEQFLMLGQSYMPAQQFHVLKNMGSASLSPWYPAADLEAGLATPEWRPFHWPDVRRFGDPQR